MTPEPGTPYLESVTEDGRKIPLNRSMVCRFGREATNTVVLPDDLVSRNHALIDCRGAGEYVLTDLGSRNGTMLNGSPIRSATRLQEADQIEIGHHKFVFRENMASSVAEDAPSSPTVAYISLELITVLVVDLVGYTHWSRNIGPEQVSVFVGTLFRQADAILRRNGVWAHKYIGDAIMAIWRHPPSLKVNVAYSALRSAVELFEALDRLNTRAQLVHPLHMKAGLNTGPASLGNLGSESNADYTALGDCVNKAFRLEAATRVVSCDVLLGDATYQWLEPESRRDVFLPQTVALKGYPDPEPAWSASIKDIEQLLRHAGIADPGIRHQTEEAQPREPHG